MAADRPYAGANASKILEVLTTTTGIEHRIGTAEDVRNSRPPRVVWVVGPATYGDPNAAQREGMKIAAERSRSFQVHFWGKDFEEAERLQDDLIGALFNKLSPYAYELGPEEDPAAGDAAHGGFELIQQVKLKRIPVPAELRPRVTLTSARAAGAITTPAGASSPGPTTTVP